MHLEFLMDIQVSYQLLHFQWLCRLGISDNSQTDKQHWCIFIYKAKLGGLEAIRLSLCNFAPPNLLLCAAGIYRSGVTVFSQCPRHEKTAVNCKNIENRHIDWRCIIEFGIECMCRLDRPLCYNSCFWLMLYFFVFLFPVSMLPLS